MTRLLHTVPVNVILSFQEGPQAFYDAEVKIPLIDGLGESQLEDVEVDVVCQILEQYPDHSENLDQLVKISLCYSRDPAHPSRAYHAALNHLVRNNAKYFFQPNQRDAIESRIAATAGVAARTKAFA